MKTIAKEYEKHYYNLKVIGEDKHIEYLIGIFIEVIEIIHGWKHQLNKRKK